MGKLGHLSARILMGQIFLLSGVFKITGYAATQGYMEAMGIPGIMLPLVIALEVGGGLAIILGWKTRWNAAALAVFTLVAAAIFHRNFADHMQQIMFMKNLAITGGLLLLVVHGGGGFSLDNRRRR